MQDLPVSVEAAIAVAVLVAVVALGAVVRALRGKRRAAPVEPEAEPPPPIPPATGGGRGARAKTRDALRRRLGEVFGRDRELGAILASLEEVLLAADVGIPTTTRILQAVRARCGSEREPAEANVRDALREAIQEALGETTTRPRNSKPWVILV